MEDINQQHQILDEKIEELQQQVRFCVNNYDYHHKNNEFQILREQVKKLEESDKAYRSFFEDMCKFRKMLEQGRRYCDEVDKLLEETLRAETVAAAEDEDKENRSQRKRNVHFEDV